MDRIMPVDLDRVKLKKSFRGYDVSEVDEILKVCARTIEAALCENQTQKKEIERLTRDLEAKCAQEGLVKEALILAQRTAEDVRVFADKCADETLALARRDADQLMAEARQAALTERIAGQQRLTDLSWEIERLTAERQRFVNGFRALLESHLVGLPTESHPTLGVVDGEMRAAAV